MIKFTIKELLRKFGLWLIKLLQNAYDHLLQSGEKMTKKDRDDYKKLDRLKDKLVKKMSR
jgi:hypothetical protein